MYLFSKDDYNTHVYKFAPVPDILRAYKEKEMSKIPEEQRVLRAITNDVEVLSASNMGNQKTFRDSEINSATSKTFLEVKYHTLKPYESTNIYEYYTTLNDYYANNFPFPKGRLAVVVKDSSVKHLLLPCDFYSIIPTEGNEKIMDGIITLPETLKNLHHVEMGDFDKVPLSFFCDISGMFVFFSDPVLSVANEDLSKMRETGLVTAMADEERIQKDTKAVRVLQKLYK